MRRVFVYEYLSDGGAADGKTDAEMLRAGQAMRDAIVSDLLALPGLMTTRAVRPRSGEPTNSFVQRMAALHDHAWIVAPETGGVLAQLHEAVGPARWIGCSAPAIRTASSKRATLAALSARAVPTPLDLADTHAGAWVVKPDDGAGAVETCVHPDLSSARADLQRRVDAGRSATLEPWVDGDALSMSLLAGAASVEAVAFNRQDVVVGTDGTLAWRGVRHGAIDPRRDARAPRLHALAAAVAQAVPGLRGYVGIDFVWHPARGPVVIEINPRVTCAYVGLSQALRRNLAGAVLALHAGGAG